MKALLLWLFTLVLVFVWVFYVIIYIHSKKFINFSNVMWRHLTILVFFLIFLSISWYLIIIFWDFSSLSFWNDSWKVINIKPIPMENTTY